MFYFEIISDLLKSCKKYTKHSCIPFIQFLDVFHILNFTPLASLCICPLPASLPLHTYVHMSFLIHLGVMPLSP